MFRLGGTWKLAVDPANDGRKQRWFEAVRPEAAEVFNVNGNGAQAGIGIKGEPQAQGASPYEALAPQGLTGRAGSATLALAVSKGAEDVQERGE